MGVHGAATQLVDFLQQLDTGQICLPRLDPTEDLRELVTFPAVRLAMVVIASWLCLRT
jgi:hypothetical protein